MSAQADFDWYAPIVSEDFGVPESAFTGRDRSRRAVFSRRVLAIILREKGHILPDIAKSLRCHHTTAMRLIKNNPDRPRTAITESLVDIATAKARKIMNETPETPADFLAADDDFHAHWLKAVADCANAPEGEREALWRDRCQEMFPYSWEAQAAQPPRGVQW